MLHNDIFFQECKKTRPQREGGAEEEVAAAKAAEDLGGLRHLRN
jgi:hypothetical protein